VFLSFIGAPAAFQVLPDSQSAGLAVGETLDRFYLMSYGVGPLLLVTTVIKNRLSQTGALRLAVTILVILVVLGLNVYARKIVASRMEAIRQGRGRLDVAVEPDSRRIAVDQLHQRSVQLMAGSMVGGLILIYLAMGTRFDAFEARRWKS